jgi:poly(3-hydroxybutyrate) depolymerase
MKKMHVLRLLSLGAVWACAADRHDTENECMAPGTCAAVLAGDAAPQPGRVNGAAGGSAFVPRDAGRAAADAAAPDAATPAEAPPDAGAVIDSGAQVQASSGCNAAQHPPSGAASIDVSGTTREYIVDVPTNYDAAHAYRLVFAWHGLGGSAAQIAGSGAFGYYGLKSRAANSTIFVAGQGLDTGQGGAGWPNTGGRDVAFVRALYERLHSQYCIDETRVFSVGMSYGGIMSNTLGCQMGDVFRAIGVMSGSGPGFGGRGVSCTGQVAAWLSHGNMDDVVPFAQGQSSRDFWRAANHCQAQSAPTDPSPCVAYAGCDPGSPVQWCEFADGHTVPQFAGAAIWNFFAQF